MNNESTLYIAREATRAKRMYSLLGQEHLGDWWAVMPYSKNKDDFYSNILDGRIPGEIVIELGGRDAPLSNAEIAVLMDLSAASVYIIINIRPISEADERRGVVRV